MNGEQEKNSDRNSSIMLLGLQPSVHLSLEDEALVSISPIAAISAIAR